MTERELNPAKLRNLVQYKDLSDEEFAEEMDKLINKDEEELNRRVQEKWAEFEEEYDIDDLKVNDREVLKALIADIISLEDLKIQHLSLRKHSAESESALVALDRLTRVMNNIQSSISKAQEDLKITRKIRKGDKESSVADYIDKLKLNAKRFSRQTMVYVFCPKCKNLLGTVWVQNSEDKRNAAVFHCNRILDDDTKCGETVKVKIAELYENGGTNISEIPEYFKF